VYAAKLHPERTYYYRKVLDLDKVLEQCTRKVSQGQWWPHRQQPRPRYSPTHRLPHHCRHHRHHRG